MAAVAAGEGFDRRHGFRREETFCVTTPINGITADAPRLVIDLERAFPLPTDTVPMHPRAPGRDVAQSVRMAVAEFECEPVFAKGDIVIELMQVLRFRRNLGLCAPNRTIRRHVAQPSGAAYHPRSCARP